MATRTATIEDLPRIAELLAELRAQEVAASSVEPQLKELFDDTQRTVIVVTNNDSSVVGLAALNLVYKLPKIECRLDEVIVSDSERGKGYGRELIEACETWAWSHSSDVLEFTSRPSREAANAMYQKLGFEIRETNVYIKKRGL
jgi:N-acetylglutamate synthase-like GNAT family acetyltransferase